MNKKLIIRFLGLGFLLVESMQVAKDEKSEISNQQSKVEAPIHFDSTVPLVKVVPSNSGSAIYNAVSMRPDFKNQASFGRSLSSAKIYNNSPFNLYIGLVGSTGLYPIPVNGFIMVATPFNYLIYASNNATGPALFLTYHSNNASAQNSVYACYVQNGVIDESIPKGSDEKFTGTAALYKDTTRPLGQVSIYVDTTGKNAFSLSSQ